MSAFDQAQSLAKQYGGDFGQALASQAASAILGTAPQAEQPTEAPAPQPSEDIEE